MPVRAPLPPRVLLRLALLLAGLGLLAATVGRPSTPPAEVATQGQERGTTERPLLGATPGTPAEGLPPAADDDASGPGTTIDTGTDTGAGDRRDGANGTTPSSATSSPTVPATTPPAAPFRGPDHLRGRLLVVTEDPGAVNALVSTAIDGTDRRAEVPCPIPAAQEWAAPAALSPDGRWVAHGCAAARRFDPQQPLGLQQLLLQRVDGTVTRVLLSSAPYLDGLAWSPDGTELAVTQPGSVERIRVADGRRTPVPLVDVDGAPVAQPGRSRLAWSPDGTQLLLDGPLVVDLPTGITHSLRRRAGTEDHVGSGDLTAWTPSGWILYRKKHDPWFGSIHRLRFDPTEYSTAVDQVSDGSLDGQPREIRELVVLDDETILLGVDGELWRVSIGPPGTSSDGTELRRLGTFSGFFASVAR